MLSYGLIAAQSSFTAPIAADYPESQTNIDLPNQSRIGGRESVRVLNYAVSGFTAVAAIIALTGDVGPTAVSVDKSTVGPVFSPDLYVARLPQHLFEAWREMEGYRHLENGWDGTGSIKPFDEAISDALSFLYALPTDLPAPEATVSADGLVGWFWRTPNVFASVSFSNQHRIVFYGHAKEQNMSARGASFFDKRSIPSDFLDLVRLA